MSDDPSIWTPGNPKRKRKIDRQWFEKCIQKAFTQDDIIQKMRSLPDKDALRLVLDYLPKETSVKTDSSISVKLILTGLQNQVKEIEGEIVEPLSLEE